MSKILVDTDILIDYLRGYPPSVEFLESQSFPLLISSITIAELYAGVKKGKENEILDNFIGTFEIIPPDTKIAQKGGLFRRDFKKSHGVGLADALIAATAKEQGVSLVTLNRKHFPMLKNILTPYVK